MVTPPPAGAEVAGAPVVALDAAGCDVAGAADVADDEVLDELPHAARLKAAAAATPAPANQSGPRRYRDEGSVLRTCRPFAETIASTTLPGPKSDLCYPDFVRGSPGTRAEKRERRRRADGRGSYDGRQLMAQAVTDQLRIMAGQFGGEVGFVDLGTGERLTFEEWDREANRLARGLAGAGVAKGDRVAIDVAPTEAVRWVIAYTAVHKAGAVAVPINTRFVDRELAEILAHGEATAAVTSAARWPALAAAAARVPTLRLAVVYGRFEGPGRSSGLRAIGWEAVASDDGSPFSREIDDDDLADIVYTSGTTGRPKGVAVRHNNASMLPVGAPNWNGGGWLAASPLFTFAGLTTVSTPMRLGMTALYLPRFDAGTWIDHVEQYQPAIVFLVPAMAELLLGEPRFATADLSSIGLCAVGSAPLAPETQRRLQARLPAAAVSNAYGMTEAGPAYTVLPKEEAERRAGSVGRPLPPAEFFAVDESGRRLPAGEAGELVIRLPGRAREYYRDPEATARAWRGDGLHTGDLATIDADGYVYIVGRLKDVIIRGGHNIYASEVEAVLYEHPAVREAAVAGVEHPVLGEDVAAWIVPVAAGAELDLDELRTFVAKRLADYKVPRRIQVVDGLPRNDTGKVVKSQLPR
jgi:acyl-CoA synthetase (AMP-forming)/AMP-acid ligase II